jgi:hypothetical protein
MPCQLPYEQMGQIISAIVLPESWVDRILAQMHHRAQDQETLIPNPAHGSGMLAKP